MRLISTLLAVVVAGTAAAQHSHSPSGHPTGGPQETGQAGFAALAEIVSILRADPETDWATVDIDGLRAHLVDMELLTTEAKVIRTLRPTGAQFEVRGVSRTLEAIQTMVPAHAPFLAAETGWDVTTKVVQDGVVLTVDGDAAQIQGLGFFGLMTIGAHHQQHHLSMAKGAEPHH